MTPNCRKSCDKRDERQINDNVSTQTQASSIDLSRTGDATCNVTSGVGCAVKMTQNGLN